MYFAKISFVLLAVLGTADNWRVRAAAQPAAHPQSSTNSIDLAEESNREQDKRYHQQPPPPQYSGYYPQQSSQPYPPLGPQPIPPLYLDQYDHRYPDGSYEFRYATPDGTVRYERGYIIPYHNTRILVVKGFYSYQLPDHRYHTVFYTADQFGFRHDSSTFSLDRPQLPRSLSEGADSDGEFRDYEAADTTPINDDLV